MILETIAAQKRGEAKGLFSLCSSNPFVLEAGFRQAAQDGTSVCIEATSNQVDQFGGYSGLTPAQFVARVHEMAVAADFPVARVIIGGDHLGPNAWRQLDSCTAMKHSVDLVHACVAAGYTKIHLDASMPCADDMRNGQPYMETHTAAERTAELCKAAEAAHAAKPSGATPPLYVVGTEVPRPGGAQAGSSGVEVTRVVDAEETITLTREAFRKRGLERAWERVVAVVVQPGVEFGDADLFAYDSARARKLSTMIAHEPRLVFEAHSTDYQTETALRQMVQDHFAILKVGPWLTFAVREAIFALAMMEDELLGMRPGLTRSGIREALDAAMLHKPEYWDKYYRGNEATRLFARKYSYSDRSRYYWTAPAVQESLARLLANLAGGLPLPLLSQYLPEQYHAVVNGTLPNDPNNLILHRIMGVTGIYARACRHGA